MITLNRLVNVLITVENVYSTSYYPVSMDKYFVAGRFSTRMGAWLFTCGSLFQNQVL